LIPGLGSTLSFGAGQNQCQASSSQAAGYFLPTASGISTPGTPSFRSIPWSQENCHLQARERELRHAIKHDMSIEKLHKAAEKLRDAKMFLLKALLKTTVRYREEDEKPIARIQKIEREQEEWNSISVEEIVQRYQDGKT
jgi:hypothetical protein